jgi:hypothetical protein
MRFDERELLGGVVQLLGRRCGVCFSAGFKEGEGGRRASGSRWPRRSKRRRRRGDTLEGGYEGPVVGVG